MELDCNTAGAWKSTGHFDLADLDAVKRAINTIGGSNARAGGKTTWRIRDGAGRVVCYWMGAELLWRDRLSTKEITP